MVGRSLPLKDVLHCEHTCNFMRGKVQLALANVLLGMKQVQGSSL